MKADKEKMFSVELASLKAEEPAPFPLYIFLPRNNRMVPLRLKGDAINQTQYEELKKNGHLSLWVPKTHESIVRSYLDFLHKDKEPNQLPDNLVKNLETDEIEKISKTAKTLLADKEPTQEQQQELTVIGTNLLQELYAITSTTISDRALISAKYKAYADEFLLACAAEENLFHEVWAARGFQSADEHSIFVGSLAAVIASTDIKFTPRDVAELITAGAFHDIGLLEVKGEILRKNFIDRSIEEKTAYEAHVKKGIALLKRSKDPIPSNIVRIIEEHHETMDGTGYPQKKVENQLLYASSLLIFSNIFDRHCTGKETGKPSSPKDTIDWIIETKAGGKKLTQQLQAMLK